MCMLSTCLMLYVLARATEASDLQKHCDKINYKLYNRDAVLVLKEIQSNQDRKKDKK